MSYPALFLFVQSVSLCFMFWSRYKMVILWMVDGWYAETAKMVVPQLAMWKIRTYPNP